MHPIAHCAERALHQHPHPALRLSELVALISERVDRSLDEVRLRAILEVHPDRFRILDPWRGPWKVGLEGPPEAWERRDAWIVALTDPADPPDHGAPATLRLRESVRWLGKGVDPRSPSEVGRWYALALSERSLRAAVSKRAA